MSLSINSLTSTIASWFRPSAVRMDGSESIFCKFPVELIREIFDYLSDKDVVAVLCLCKDVNVSINRAMEPRIRCAIYAIFNESRAFTCRPNAPLYVLKKSVPTALNLIRTRKIEQAERVKTETTLARRAEKRRVSRERMVASNCITSTIFLASFPPNTLMNAVSNEVASESMHRYDGLDFNF